MADKKISALTAATTPLAGTEVLPIVQSAATVKVATDDLTVKNVRSNATSGILQIAGPAASATRTMTVPDANFTAARTDAAQSFTGNQTLSTGNLVVGTAGKGVDFSANANAAGMTSELLDWYETGTWTPTLRFGGATTGIGYDIQQGKYTRIGIMVFFTCTIYLNSKGSATGDATITGLPFTKANDSIAAPAAIYGDRITNFQAVVAANSTTVSLYAVASGSATTVATIKHTDFANTTYVSISGQYNAV